jgi:hypothetical protein
MGLFNPNIDIYHHFDFKEQNSKNSAHKFIRIHKVIVDSNRQKFTLCGELYMMKQAF